MSIQRETTESIEQYDAENVGHPAHANANLRKRVVAVFVIVTTWLMSTVITYYKCTYPGNTDWLGFLGYETIIGAFVVVCIVQVFRKPSKP